MPNRHAHGEDMPVPSMLRYTPMLHHESHAATQPCQPMQRSKCIEMTATFKPTIPPCCLTVLPLSSHLQRGRLPTCLPRC